MTKKDLRRAAEKGAKRTKERVLAFANAVGKEVKRAQRRRKVRRALREGAAVLKTAGEAAFVAGITTAASIGVARLAKGRREKKQERAAPPTA